MSDSAIRAETRSPPRSTVPGPVAPRCSAHFFPPAIRPAYSRKSLTHFAAIFGARIADPDLPPPAINLAGTISARRAISVTTAPGALGNNARFCSALQRRRSGPVMTSTLAIAPYLASTSANTVACTSAYQPDPPPLRKAAITGRLPKVGNRLSGKSKTNWLKNPAQVAEIVSSYVRHHQIAAAQLAGLIVEVHRALASLGRATPAQAAPASAGRPRPRNSGLPHPLETAGESSSDSAELFDAALNGGQGNGFRAPRCRETEPAGNRAANDPAPR
jgi:hypothetical protein